MKESVSGILIFKDEIFIIRRQNFLRAFPGYYSFPGGKVDKEDMDTADHLLTALDRELHEELGVSLFDLQESGTVTDIVKLGIAVTPDFNPHRFENHYYKIFLNEKIDLKVDAGEAAFSGWMNVKEAFDKYHASDMLVVPPMISILEDLATNIDSHDLIDPNLKYDTATEVPLIRPLFDINQFLPLSNTFPPANRTNCFVIGDDYKVLIDPSPKNREEYEKLLNCIRDIDIDTIFLTHHHPDHHEFSTDLARGLELPMAMSEDTRDRLTKKLGSSYFKGIEIKLYTDGDTLTKCNNLNVVIIHTPGHDEGQLSLYREDGAWVIVSDLIQTVGTVTVGGDEADMNKYFRSLEKIIKLNPKVVIPSHGISIGGTNKLEFTLNHRLEREQQVKELLKQNASNELMLKTIYPDLPERLHPYAEQTIESHILKLKLHGEG